MPRPCILNPVTLWTGHRIHAVLHFACKRSLRGGMRAIFSAQVVQEIRTRAAPTGDEHLLIKVNLTTLFAFGGVTRDPFAVAVYVFPKWTSM